ncbi:MAG: hypothetical protein ACKVTZ_03355 [Bacteroidia bacterium]
MKRLQQFFAALKQAFRLLFTGKEEEIVTTVAAEPVPETAREIAPATNFMQTPSFGQGLDCPRCQHKIPISMEILIGGQVICPKCFLSLQVDTQQSAETLAALRKLKTAFEKAEEARKV